MPFLTRMRGRRSGLSDPASPPPSANAAPLSREDKLAIIEDLEERGLAWFWATDAQGHVTYLSPRIAASAGVAVDDLIGRPLTAVLTPVGQGGEAPSLALKLAARKSFAGFTVQVGEGGRTLVLRLSGRPVSDAAGAFLGFRGSGINVTDAFLGEQEAARQARSDALTGLANRYRMEQVIDATLLAFGASRRACALMMLDLDRFKHVNDTLGHAAGDKLLVEVARRIESVVGSRGEIGRLGGDEFQVLLPDLDDRGQLGDLARKIITMLSQPFALEEGRCSIGTSVGIAIAPYDGVGRDELTRAADLALYAAKHNGRGQFRFYAVDLEAEDRLRRQMEEDLAAAIEAGHIRVEYQPVVALADNRVCALQLQYVWHDPERGRVSADTFMPVAEASRLVTRIGRDGLRQACRDAAQWPAGLRLVVPVSPVQFTDRQFLDDVEAALDESGLDPQRLQIEVGEDLYRNDHDEVERIVSALFRRGVRLSLDQFGSGYVSLSYLRRAPFCTIKLGQSFFESTITDTLGDLEMVQAIVELAKVLRLETVAAGVGSMALLEALRGRGITHAQGFVFSEALAAEEVAAQLAADDWQLEPVRDGAQRAGRRTVFRRVGLIHQDHYYEVTLRNLSRTGAMIEGLEDVPVGTQFVLDFGGGQLAVATVVRTDGDTQGLEFESALVDDGAGGLCTRHRVSPYALAVAGAPVAALGAGPSLIAGGEKGGGSPACFTLSARAPRAGDAQS